MEVLAAYCVGGLAPMFFYDLYPYRSLLKYVRIFQIQSLVFIVANLLVQDRSFQLFYELTHNVFNVSVIGAIVLMIVITTRAVREKRIGSKYIFYGLIICSLFVIGEVLKKSGWVPDFETNGPNLLNTGVLLLFFFQSIFTFSYLCKFL